MIPGMLLQAVKLYFLTQKRSLVGESYQESHLKSGLWNLCSPIFLIWLPWWQKSRYTFYLLVYTMWPWLCDKLTPNMHQDLQDLMQMMDNGMMHHEACWMMDDEQQISCHAIGRCKVCLKKLKDVQAKHSCGFAWKWWLSTESSGIMCQSTWLPPAPTSTFASLWCRRSVINSTGHRLGGAMMTAQKQYAIGNKFNLRAPPALSFFLGKGVIRQWWISAAE